MFLPFLLKSWIDNRRIACAMNLYGIRPENICMTESQLPRCQQLRDAFIIPIVNMMVTFLMFCILRNNFRPLIKAKLQKLLRTANGKNLYACIKKRYADGKFIFEFCICQEGCSVECQLQASLPNLLLSLLTLNTRLCCFLCCLPFCFQCRIERLDTLILCKCPTPNMIENQHITRILFCQASFFKFLADG